MWKLLWSFVNPYRGAREAKLDSLLDLRSAAKPQPRVRKLKVADELGDRRAREDSYSQRLRVL